MGVQMVPTSSTRVSELNGTQWLDAQGNPLEGSHHEGDRILQFSNGFLHDDEDIPAVAYFDGHSEFFTHGELQMIVSSASTEIYHKGICTQVVSHG
jgi:hypothetical protein